MGLRLKLLAALVILGWVPVWTQAPARPQLPSRVESGDASIAGRVIDRATDHPIAGALITLATLSPAATSLITETDGDGKYAFQHIAAGRYRVTASHPRYVTSV